MSGVKLAALYGVYPFRLGFCGPQEKSAKKVLLDYLSGEKVSEREARKILEQFKGAFAYYKLIAKCNNIRDPFDEKVISAYWIGNKLLEKVPVDSLREMITKKFTGPGLLSKMEAKKKAKGIPLNSKPHHSFHVLVIGSVTGVIDLKGKLIDLCRISWGEVVRKSKIQNPKSKNYSNKVLIEYQPLVKNKKFHLGKIIKKEIFWDRNLVHNIKKGKIVSVH